MSALVSFKIPNNNPEVSTSGSKMHPPSSHSTSSEHRSNISTSILDRPSSMSLEDSIGIITRQIIQNLLTFERLVVNLDGGRDGEMMFMRLKEQEEILREREGRTESEGKFQSKIGSVDESVPSLPASGEHIRKEPPSDLEDRPTQKRKVIYKHETRSGQEILENAFLSIVNSISELLGGEGWKSQTIGKIGTVQLKTLTSCEVLLRAVELSIQYSPAPQIVNGLFNSILVEGLVRAWSERQKEGKLQSDLKSCDFSRAIQLLVDNRGENGKIGSSFAHSIDKSSASETLNRWPFDRTDFSERQLLHIRPICRLWKNDQWISQTHLLSLSGFSLKDPMYINWLLEIAAMTRVKEGEPIPNGFPQIVLQVIRLTVKARMETNNFLGGWSQTKSLLADILNNLQRELGLDGEVSFLHALLSSEVEVGERFESNKSRTQVGNGKEPFSSNTMKINEHSNSNSSFIGPFGSTKISNASKTFPDSSSASRQGVSISRIHDEAPDLSSNLPSFSNQYSEEEISRFKEMIKMLEGIVESHERKKRIRGSE